MSRVRGTSRPRFRLLPTVLLTVAILGLPTAVYAWGRSSSSFAIQHIAVTGTKLVPQKRVLRLLRRDYSGRNLFTVTASDVRSTLSPLPYVAGVALDRDFPETLRVNVIEHVPVAYGLVGTRWYVLDAAGQVICEAENGIVKKRTSGTSPVGASPGASPSPPAGTDAAATAGVTTTKDATTTKGAATSTGATRGADSTGTASTAGTANATTGASSDSATVLERLVSGPPNALLPLPRVSVIGQVRVGDVPKDPALAQSLTVIDALPQSLRSDLDVVQNEDGQITLRFADGPVAVWGDSARIIAKTVALRAVLARYQQAGKVCTELDVSIPDRVIAKPVLPQVLE